MRTATIVFCSICVFLIGGCCKDKTGNACNEAAFVVDPFLERYAYFTCGGNLYEYQYVMRRKAQIDSLSDCNFSPPVPFPVNETDFIYIMFGKMSYFRYDTFQTILFKDTCLKKVTYQVDMIQHDTTHRQFPGVISMFCSVENIPADYEVEVKYKYVPLP
ncbi:MAG TPA: hypothetical protein PLW44_03910 [Chitinophagales bacterium]|nr:hypothetical protein [Chitinophagales bacterium]